MAQLISPSDFLNLTDRLGAAWALGLAAMGTGAGSAVPGTARGTLTALRDNILSIAIYEPEVDLLFEANKVMEQAPAEVVMGFLTTMLSALNGHIASRGQTVDSSITDLDTYLAYYSGGAGGPIFSTLTDPDFASLYAALMGTRLASPGVMSPALHPYIDPVMYSSGLGRRAVAGPFVDGADVDTTQYAEVVPTIEIITTFSGGATAVTATLAGVDDQGQNCTYGPVTMTGGNNPVADLSGVTFTTPVSAGSRQIVTFSSIAGVVRGSVLKIDASTPSEEVIIVESVTIADVTAVFRKAHTAGATVTGQVTMVAGDASTGPGRRLRDLTDITLTIGTHAAGAVRVIGRQDRVGI